MSFLTSSLWVSHPNDSSELLSETVGEHNRKWNTRALQMVSCLWHCWAGVELCSLCFCISWQNTSHLSSSPWAQQWVTARSNLTNLHLGNFTLTLGSLMHRYLMHNSNICITTDSFPPSIIPWWILMIHRERRDETIEQVIELASNVLSRQLIVFSLPLLPEFSFLYQEFEKANAESILSQYVTYIIVIYVYCNIYIIIYNI